MHDLQDTLREALEGPLPPRVRKLVEQAIDEIELLVTDKIPTLEPINIHIAEFSDETKRSLGWI
jgi:hypothetical protein